MVLSRTTGARIARAIIAAVLALCALVCVAPVINTLAISLSDGALASPGKVKFWPAGFSLDAYSVLIRDTAFLRSFLVSVERVLLGGGINIALCLLMAYPLSKGKREFRWRDGYMWVVVFTMLFSGGLIPWYYVITRLGIIDTIWALVLPPAVPVFSVIILMNYFKGIPRSMEEAAVIDGAGPLRILLQIYIPLSLPAIATITLFSVVNHWNSFFDGIILINTPEKIPLSSYIQRIVVQTGFQSLNREVLIKIDKLTNSTLNASKVMIAMLPILAIYPFLQRYFIHGLVLGAIKE